MSAYRAQTTLTIRDLARMKREGERIACLTAYDASFARLLDSAGADVLLVGDSLGMVVQGHESTVSVDMDAMVYHTRLVARGRKRAFLIADMPFMSYASVEAALANAARLLREGGAQMVKLEAGSRQTAIVAELSGQGIPVCAHLGLMPQAIHKLGGYARQGGDPASARQMLEHAQALEAAGADVLLLECVADDLAKQITQAIRIPVIGIGSGRDCDGQILVIYDVLGISEQAPKFAKNFLQGRGDIAAAVGDYVAAVKSGEFP